MANFVKITTRVEIRTWVRAEEISSIEQLSTQTGDNEGTVIMAEIMADGTNIEAIDLNATLEMLG